MNKGSSDNYPKLVEQSNGFYQIRFCILPEELIFENKKRTVYTFEYAETLSIEYGAIVDAIIGTRYNKSVELSMINKALADINSEEYKIYNEFRVFAKEAAKQAILYFTTQ